MFDKNYRIGKGIFERISLKFLIYFDSHSNESTIDTALIQVYLLIFLALSCRRNHKIRIQFWNVHRIRMKKNNRSLSGICFFEWSTSWSWSMRAYIPQQSGQDDSVHIDHYHDWVVLKVVECGGYWRGLLILDKGIYWNDF